MNWEEDNIAEETLRHMVDDSYSESLEENYD